MYDAMQIFTLSSTVRFPLNSLGHEMLNESFLKSTVLRLNRTCVIQSCDVTGGGLNPPELFVSHYSHNLLYSFPKQMDTINNPT